MATDPRWIDEHGNEIDEDHRGLVYDIRTLVDRRRALGLFGGIGVTALLAACAAPETTPTASAAATATTPSATATPTPSAAASGPVSRGARRDRRALPGRRLERRERARRLGHRAQRHPLELRLVDDGRRGRAAHDRAHGAGCRDGQRARRRRRLPLALRPRRQLLALPRRRRGRELPARGAGDRRERHRAVHVDLPGLLLGPLAAHPLRGVLGCRERRRVGSHREDLADRAARGGQRTRLRHVGLRAERAQRVAGEPGRRQRVRRRRRHPPDRDACRGRSPTATPRRSRSGCSRDGIPHSPRPRRGARSDAARRRGSRAAAGRMPRRDFR